MPPVVVSNAAERVLPDSFADTVAAVKPTAVNVSAVQVARTPGALPFRDFLERYFGERLPPEKPRQSLGSGVIVSPDGYVLTNNHVIEDARMIIVRLSEDEEHEGRVVGKDPPTAARAGLRAGDLIVQFDDKAIRRAGELPRLTAKAPAGKDVAVRVVREGRDLSVQVRLGELPARL